MKLAYWMYAGPAHIGTLRVASSFKNVHAIMHAPLGDDYFNVMRSMLERERDFTPVTASIVDRHVLARGSQEKVVENITRKDKEETPDLILLTPTCTSSILQEDLENFVERASILSKENTKTTFAPSLVAPQVSFVTLAPSPSPSPSSFGGKEHLLEAKGTRAFLCDSKKVQTVGLGGTSLNITSYTNNSEHQAKATNNDSNLSLGKANVSDVILADVNHYRVNELQAADRTLEQIVRFYLEKEKRNLAAVSYLSSANAQPQPLKGLEGQLPALIKKTSTPSVNIIGTFTLGFHNQHDCRELKRLFSDLGITINLIIPEGGSVTDLKKLPNAWFNFVPYREVGLMTAMYLKNEFNMPYVATTPMGLIDTAQCIREIAQVLNEVSLNQEIMSKYEHYIDVQTRFVSQAAWFTRSIDCQNLLGKKAVVFGDATHAAAMTKILSREMGIRVAFAGTYCKHDADWFREQVSGFCDQILITDDHTQVGDMIKKAEPAAIFGTQMERHVGKRLDIPCGVISAPVHIQNFPLGYRPFLGYEGTNQIADLVYNSFSLGMEDHLLQIFGGHDNKTTHTNLTPSLTSEASHLHLAPTVLVQEGAKMKKAASDPTRVQRDVTTSGVQWSEEGLVELKKVPGFVRGKVQRNTEKYALDNNLSLITIEVMYAAKEAVSKA